MINAGSGHVLRKAELDTVILKPSLAPLHSWAKLRAEAVCECLRGTVASHISGRLPLGPLPQPWLGSPGAQWRGFGMLSGSTGTPLFLRPVVLCIQMGRSPTRSSAGGQRPLAMCPRHLGTLRRRIRGCAETSSLGTCAGSRGSRCPLAQVSRCYGSDPGAAGPAPPPHHKG